MKNNELWLINTEVNVCEIKKNEDIITVVDKYCGPQVRYFAYMYIAALPSCISSLLSTFRLFQAFLGYAECFFCHTKHFSAMLSPFLLCQAFFFHADHLLPWPSTFLLCWGLLSSSEHFSATLSTSRLFQSFISYSERCFGSSKHISAMLNIFFLLCQAFFGYAEHFSALPSIFLLF